MNAAVPGLRGVSRESLAAVVDRQEELLSARGSDAAALASELFAVVHLLDGQHSLRRALSDPSKSGQRKVAAARALLDDRLGPATLDVVEHLVRSRWARAGDLPDAAETLAVLAEVTRAEAAGHLDDLEDELFRFGRILQGQPRLRMALADPGLPAERKRRLLDELLREKARPSTVLLVTEIVVHPRGRPVDRGLQVYGHIAAGRRQRLVAFVRSATPLSEQQRDRLADALADTYGHAVHLNVEIDPDVLGGLSVRLGDEVIDGTIAGRLERIRRRLAH